MPNTTTVIVGGSTSITPNTTLPRATRNHTLTCALDKRDSVPLEIEIQSTRDPIISFGPPYPTSFRNDNGRLVGTITPNKDLLTIPNVRLRNNNTNGAGRVRIRITITNKIAKSTGIATLSYL